MTATPDLPATGGQDDAAGLPPLPAADAVRTRGVAATAALCLLALLVVAGSVAGAWLLQQHRTGASLADARADALAAARQEALNLIAVDGRDTDKDIAAVLEGATGAFKDDFTSRSADLKRVITGAKVVSTDLRITEAAVVAADRDSATVLVAADSVVQNAAKPDGSPRSYRMLLELERVGERWLTSSLEVVG